MYIYMYDIKLAYFDKKTKTEPMRGNDAGTAEGIIAGSGGASKMRHVQQKARREVDVISI